jgi:23S rRNA (cytidine1920-2'-O)/16S rRNA (cytidine1409-2'-O)-methyltransferase
MKSMTERERADRLLVARGLFESRARAQAAIAAGLVTADGLAVVKPADMIARDAVIAAEPAHPYVSRGALKLAAALDRFATVVTGTICLDVGASTGGFTEVLLTRGASRVYAVDVGQSQLHQSLKADRRIMSLERTDIRRLDPAVFAEHPSLAVIDVSFISLKLVLPAVAALVSDRATLIALIKPQFEAGRRDIKKGIVRDAAVHDAIVAEIARFVGAMGWQVGGTMPSPVAGGDGNREFLIEARRG